MWSGRMQASSYSVHLSCGCETDANDCFCDCPNSHRSHLIWLGLLWTECG